MPPTETPASRQAFSNSYPSKMEINDASNQQQQPCRRLRHNNPFAKPNVSSELRNPPRIGPSSCKAVIPGSAIYIPQATRLHHRLKVVTDAWGHRHGSGKEKIRNAAREARHNDRS